MKRIKKNLDIRLLYLHQMEDTILISETGGIFKAIPSVHTSINQHVLRGLATDKGQDLINKPNWWINIAICRSSRSTGRITDTHYLTPACDNRIIRKWPAKSTRTVRNYSHFRFVNLARNFALKVRTLRGADNILRGTLASGAALWSGFHENAANLLFDGTHCGSRIKLHVLRMEISSFFLRLTSRSTRINMKSDANEDMWCIC